MQPFVRFFRLPRLPKFAFRGNSFDTTSAVSLCELREEEADFVRFSQAWEAHFLCDSTMHVWFRRLFCINCAKGSDDVRKVLSGARRCRSAKVLDSQMLFWMIVQKSRLKIFELFDVSNCMVLCLISVQHGSWWLYPNNTSRLFLSACNGINAIMSQQRLLNERKIATTSN